MTAFFEAMLNGWWQGIALTLLVWLVLRDLPRVSAATRMAIWQVTLVAVLLLPALQRIPVAPLWRQVAPAVAATMAPPPSPGALRSPGDSPLAPVASSPIAARPRPLLELPEDDGGLLLAVVFSSALAITQLLRLAIGYWVVRRLKRRAEPAGVPLPVRLSRPAVVLISDKIAMPMAVGYRRPAILLPRNLFDGLTPEQLRHVLLHESAHLLRRDDWMALAERVIRAVFFFQPAVHWIGRRIEREREIACDDWVIAQTDEPTPYATSLARIAELASHDGRAPLLATGAGRPKQIFARLETLLDGTRNRMPSVSEPMVIAAGAILLFAVAQGANFNRMLGFGHYSDNWVESNGANRKAIRMSGEIHFTPDDKDVESMSPGARLLIEQSEGWRARSVEFEAGEDGRIDRRFFSNGIARPFDGEARSFLAKVLPMWVRERGLDIPERLARSLRDRGPDGALQDIRSIRSSHVKRAYLEEFFGQAPASDAHLGRALKIAGEMDSDSERRQFFETIQTRYFSARGADAQFIAFVDGIPSDHERRILLGLAIDQTGLDQMSLGRVLRSAGRIPSDNVKADLLRQTAQATKAPLPGDFFDAAAAINSDGDRERVLLAALSLHGDHPGTVAAVMRAAVSMPSDGAKAKLVVESARRFPAGPEALREASRVLASIHSDGDRRRSLEALVEAGGKDVETLREVLQHTMTMNSDGDKSHVLLRVAGAFAGQDPWRGAFFSAVNTLHSSGDQRRVLMAVLARPQLDPETLREVSRSASQITSDADQAVVLKAVSDRR